MKLRLLLAALALAGCASPRLPATINGLDQANWVLTGSTAEAEVWLGLLQWFQTPPDLIVIDGEIAAQGAEDAAAVIESSDPSTFEMIEALKDAAAQAWLVEHAREGGEMGLRGSIVLITTKAGS